MSEVRHLRIVDSETGEVHDECPSCLQYERDLRHLKAKLTRLQQDQERVAREHKLWAEAQTVHDWWKLATGHFGVTFTAEDFQQALPRLKEVGPVGLLKAVAGAAYDPSTTRMKNGGLEAFCGWGPVCRITAKYRSFTERVPGGEEDDVTWRRWLIDRIESNLKEGK